MRAGKRSSQYGRTALSGSQEPRTYGSDVSGSPAVQKQNVYFVHHMPCKVTESNISDMSHISQCHWAVLQATEATTNDK